MILNVCTNPNLLKVVLIIKNIINIMKIVIPLLLIVFLMFDLVKGITSGKEDKVMASIKIIPRKLIAAVLFFLIPTIIDVTLNLMDENLNIEYAKCITNANSEKIKELYLSNAEEAVAKAESTLNKLDLFDATNMVSKIDSEANSAIKEALEVRLKKASSNIYKNSSKPEESGNIGAVTETDYDFPDYSQCGSWTTLKLANGNSYNNCNCGCGPTSLSIVASGLNNDPSITPASVVKYISGYENLGCGTNESTLTHGNITNKYNIKPTYLFTKSSGLSDSQKKEKIIEELKLGRPIIIHVPKHYVVLTKITGDKITVQDPGRKKEYNGDYTIDALFTKFGDYKNRCSKPESGESKNCGIHSAISYYSL